MPDPYLPALDTFALTHDEQAVVAAALATEKPWDWKPAGVQKALLASVKAKIRDFHMARHGNRCCYCRFPLQGGGHFVMDREHVLPKSIDAYRHLAYEAWNLGIACKRCNMQYKLAKVDFLIDQADAAALQDGANYRLIHPNFDLYKDHLSIRMEMSDDVTLMKYTQHPGSEKGAYTYTYFNLRGREVGTFDDAQGIDVSADLGPGALAAQELAREYGQ